MGVHEGHRARMRKRLQETDVEHLEEHEVLEMLLYLSTPRRDTNALAHTLLSRFGSFYGVLMAREEELAEIKGVGPQTVWLLSNLPNLFRFFEYTRRSRPKKFSNTAELGAYLIPRFLAQTNESVVIVLLDRNGKLLHEERLSYGTVSAANIQYRALAELALQYKARKIILAHNHPSGIAIPSIDDQMTTLHLKKSLRELEIDLIDHIVVAGDDFVSMAESGLLRQEYV